MKFLNQIKIGTRLGAGFSVLLMMTLIAVCIGWLQLRVMQGDFNEVTVNTLPSILLAGDMRSDAEEVRRSQIRLVTEAELSARKRVISDIDDVRSLLKTIYDAYGQDMVKGEQDRQLWKDLGAALAVYDDLSVKLEVIARTDTEEDAGAAPIAAEGAAAPAAEAATGKAAAALSARLEEAVYGDAYSAFASVIDKLDKLKAFNLQRSRDAEAHGKSTFKRSQIVLAIAATVTLALGVLISLTLTRSVVVPLARAVTALRGVADGNLDTQIDVRGKDELTDMLRELARMQESLRTVVTDIRDSSESVSNSSVEIAAGILDLSVRTEHQAAQLEEAAASMEQLTAAVKQSTQTAHEVDQLADLASGAALRGSEVVGKVVDTMHGIQRSSDRISEIIAVIDGIAFQTNILALNAAVEAARAGEQGRGFAVVASEVRNLAQRSAGAAKEIKTLIVNSAEQVTGGSRLVEDAGRSMADIQTQVDKVTSLISGILSGATEQASGIALVNRAVGELDAATQMNAALVEQASAASESLKQQAGRLVEVVSVFRTDGEEEQESEQESEHDPEQVRADEDQDDPAFLAIAS
ncbi:MAG: methyl-accepting chemotaxis protein [Pseudomonadota bacterium]